MTDEIDVFEATLSIVKNDADSHLAWMTAVIAFMSAPIVLDDYTEEFKERLRRMDETEIRREALARILAGFPPEEITTLRAKLALRGRLFPMAESLFDWVMELHDHPPREASEELVQGLSFLAKRVNQELVKLMDEK